MEVSNNMDDVVRYFSPEMIGKRVEIGVYRLDDDSWVASYGGKLEGYVKYKEEIRWSMQVSHPVSRVDGHSLVFANTYYYLVTILED
jgi:hypothetical protein